METLKKLLRDESGPTLLEYVGLGVLLLIAIWGAVTMLSGTVNDRFQNIDQKFKSYN
ncbi:MAG: Flp family type IVb pilin [Syntrophothermus sp.]|uniref:Flp family type IVb pilin n=1 Tax=Syntrophothermus sp. TaxID=2736299 RepID=UPI0025799155|nr:hypothetical protein [Syntrophothermus sp.]NSW83606.1 Flp family type IVb pilin [Syntrophothermus sp.]